MHNDMSILLIGWDVGGWNCDRNRLSRDALVVVDHNLHVLGKLWRGNLRERINQADTTLSFVQALLDCCQIEEPLTSATQIVLGIDTPLGFSSEFMDLLANGQAAAKVHGSATNPYLFRFTERFLFENGLAPLSAIKDMIGSQATKGMHVLACFIPERSQCGVWTDNSFATTIEVYPSSAKRSVTVNDLRSQCLGLSNLSISDWHEDEQDALTAALLAWMFRFKPELMAWPLSEAPAREGWIFVPSDSLSSSRHIRYP